MPYSPSKEEKETLKELNDRIDYLKKYRSAIKANPYDVSSKARSIEDTWDFADYVSLPHKFSSKDMKSWMANCSRPMIYAKIDTAVATLIAKNPEVEISARTPKYDNKAKLLESLYRLTWDKGDGRQQLIKFMMSAARYGFAAGREYHRYKELEIEEVVDYDPTARQLKTEKKKIVKYDEPFFEVLPIRDCWFDDRARPYDVSSMRDWFYEKTYDENTFELEFPVSKYPNAEHVVASFSASARDNKDKADIADDQTTRNKVRLQFYENIETNRMQITDGAVLLYDEPLLDNELSCVTAMWRMRNDWCIYGVGLPEILEGDAELINKLSNMSVNQAMLAIGGSGFYGGSGNITDKEATLEPKIKKLRDVDKLVFPKVPMPDANIQNMVNDLREEANEVSGVTQVLEGDPLGKTLGEAVLVREAGLRRLAIPLTNIEFALERQAKLRINNIQRVYSRPQETVVLRDSAGKITDESLFRKYLEERAKLGSDNVGFINKYPEDLETGVVFQNNYKQTRLALNKAEDGGYEPSDQDQWLEITPEEIRGEYDVSVKAMSTIPTSQALEEAKAMETFNLVVNLPYTDIYKSQERLLKMRGENPEDWMKSEQEILEQQQQAQMAQQMGAVPGEVPAQEPVESQQPVQNPITEQAIA